MAFWHARHSRSSPPEVFLRKYVVKICSKFRAEHPCRSVISIKLLCNFIEIALRHRCSPVNLLHIFRTPFPKNTSRWLLLALGHSSHSRYSGTRSTMALNALKAAGYLSHFNCLLIYLFFL